jgi:hypothetical protein
MSAEGKAATEKRPVSAKLQADCGNEEGQMREEK